MSQQRGQQLTTWQLGNNSENIDNAHFPTSYYREHFTEPSQQQRRRTSYRPTGESNIFPKENDYIKTSVNTDSYKRFDMSELVKPIRWPNERLQYDGAMDMRTIQRESFKGGNGQRHDIVKRNGSAGIWNSGDRFDTVSTTADAYRRANIDQSTPIRRRRYRSDSSHMVAQSIRNDSAPGILTSTTRDDFRAKLGDRYPIRRFDNTDNSFKLSNGNSFSLNDISSTHRDHFKQQSRIFERPMPIRQPSSTIIFGDGLQQAYNSSETRDRYRIQGKIDECRFPTVRYADTDILNRF